MLFAQGPVAAAAAFYFIIMSAAKPPRAAIHLSGLARLLNYYSLAQLTSTQRRTPQAPKSVWKTTERRF
jgi:hypothetical protein